MTECVPPQVFPNHTKMTRTVAEVADNLDKARNPGGLLGNWSSGKIKKRGEAYMDGSRMLYEEYGAMMQPIHNANVAHQINM